METLSIVADVCGILGFLISLFVFNRVIKINKKISATDNSIKQTARGKGNKQNVMTNK